MLALGFVVLGNRSQEQGYLPVALARSVAVGAVAGKADVARCLVDITVQHQFVGQFPHRSLVHGGITYIG